MARVPSGPYAPGLLDGGFAVLTDDPAGPTRQLVAELAPDRRATSALCEQQLARRPAARALFKRTRRLYVEAARLEHRRRKDEVGERVISRGGPRAGGVAGLRRASAGEVLSRPGRKARV